MADFLHIDSPEGILLLVDEDVMPTLSQLLIILNNIIALLAHLISTT